MMKNIAEKQLLEWKEELANQKQKQAQAQKVLQETTQAIQMIEGGVQAVEMLLKKFELSNQQSNKEGQEQAKEPKASK